MAKLPPVKRIIKEDFLEVPWIGKLLQPLSDFMENVYFALNAKLTHKDNILSDIRTLDVTGGEFPMSFTVNLGAGSKPGHLVVTKVTENTDNPAVITGAVFAHWDFQNNKVRIRNISGLTPGTRYNVTVIVYPE